MMSKLKAISKLGARSKLGATVGVAAGTPALLAAVALLATATPAAAASIGSGIGSNYTFPNGSPGFALNAFLPVGDADLAMSSFLSPEVLVGFNPQPDPPGTPATFLSLGDPTAPVFTNLSGSVTYGFIISFINFSPPDPCDMTLPTPNRDGKTGFSCSGLTDGVVNSLDAALTFTGPGGVVDWVSFNPQPDPPGDVAAFDVTFGGDASVALSISVDGTPLDFALVPEPGTLSLFGTALIGLAAWRRRRRHS
jgi:PEP-CTERM motif